MITQVLPQNILGTFCADPLTDSSNPYSGGVCIDVTVGTAGLCIDITPALNPASNGVTSFSPDNNAICQMFTFVSHILSVCDHELIVDGPSDRKSNCTGDVWASGIVLPASQSLSFDGIVPDNAILSVQCTQ